MQESPSEVVIYFEEKNAIPEQYSGRETRNKRFYDLVVVQDFLFVVKTLNIRRRHWILKQSNQYINRNWRMVAEGICMAQYLFCVFFIKELY